MVHMSTSSYQIYATSADAWRGMKSAIHEAQKSIYWEMYIFVDDDAGRDFFDLLEQKAHEGVDVKLIIDSVGSFWVSRRRIQSLKDAGVDVHLFHERKHRYRGLWKKLVTRTHRKVLVVDERVGFIGGVNIQKNMKDWLDIHIRIEGDPVRSLLRAFARMYLICGGEKDAVRHLLQYKFRVARHAQDVEFIFDEATGKSRARKKYAEALLKARERVILFSPYYFPDRHFLQALWAARRRGVRVDLLIPFRTDLRIATYAAYAWFSLMSRRGVHVHLMKQMMHGKGVIVDDEWAMVGSSNIDHGSFYDNYEANVHVKDKAAVKKLTAILEGWMSMSEHLDGAHWEKRGLLQRAKEWIALKLYRTWHRRR